jgi:Ca-activated chloride channel homolog
MNRLVLITDGRANPKSIDPNFIGEHAKQGDDDGIYLVGVGTGPAEGYNDALLNTLTDYGRGAYVYIDSEAEAVKMFSGRFSEVMDIAARNVAVTLTLPNFFMLQQYYGESISTPDAAPEPQHLAPGDAMVFNMALSSLCDVAFASADAVVSVHVDWKTPITKEDRFEDLTVPLQDLTLPEAKLIVKANAVIAYAEALKTLDGKRLVDAQVAVQDAYNKTSDPDLKGIVDLIALHPAMKP